MSPEQKYAQLLIQFGEKIHITTSLLEGGHVTVKDAYYELKKNWKEMKLKKREMFPEMTFDDDSDEE